MLRLSETRRTQTKGLHGGWMGWKAWLQSTVQPTRNCNSTDGIFSLSLSCTRWTNPSSSPLFASLSWYMSVHAYPFGGISNARFLLADRFPTPGWRTVSQAAKNQRMGKFDSYVSLSLKVFMVSRWNIAPTKSYVVKKVTFIPRIVYCNCLSQKYSYTYHR